MNITNLNSQLLLGQGYVPMSNTSSVSVNKDSAFSAMLEKAAEAREQETQILAGGKAVIDKTDKLFEMCQELETFLLKTLISSMRDTVQKSELLDTGFAGKFYEDMLYDEYAKDFSKNAGFGLAEMAYLELTGQRGKTLAQPRF